MMSSVKSWGRVLAAEDTARKWPCGRIQLDIEKNRRKVQESGAYSVRKQLILDKIMWGL